MGGGRHSGGANKSALSSLWSSNWVMALLASNHEELPYYCLLPAGSAGAWERRDYHPVSTGPL